MQGLNPAGVRFYKTHTETAYCYLLLFLFSCKRQLRMLYESHWHDNENSKLRPGSLVSIAALWQLLKRALAPCKAGVELHEFSVGEQCNPTSRADLIRTGRQTIKGRCPTTTREGAPIHGNTTTQTAG